MSTNENGSISIPEILPLFTLRDMVAFPYMIFPLFLKDEEMEAFEEARRYQNLITIVKLRDEKTGDVASDVHEIGSVCKVNQLYKLPDGGAKVILEGLMRVRISLIIQEVPFILARVEPVREFVEKSVVSDALLQSLNALLKIALSYGRPLPDDVLKMIDYIDSPARFSDLVALYVTLSMDELQKLLETVDPLER